MNVLPTMLQAGLSGISRGQESLQDIATDIAQAGLKDEQDQTTDLTQSLIDLKQQQLATLASIKVVDAADEVLGSLLDIMI